MSALEFKLKQQLTENAGLFNEINPVYISLNMGRPCTAFAQDYVSQDQFRLIKREGISLMGRRWMMVNFLKSDYVTQNLNAAPNSPGGDSTLGFIHQNNSNEQVTKLSHYIMRVVAFENETSCQFTFDLNYNDLLILTHGNIKLLEDESSNDLC